MEKFEKYYTLMNEELVSKEFKEIIFDIIQKQNKEEDITRKIHSDILEEFCNMNDSVNKRINALENTLFDEIDEIKNTIELLHEDDDSCNEECCKCGEHSIEVIND